MSASGWVVWARVARYNVPIHGGGAPYAPGMFTDSLERRVGTLPFWFQHDSRQPLGVAVDFDDNDRALDMAFHVPNMPRGVDAIELMGALGANAQFSTTYQHRCGPAFSRSTDLIEVSLVVPYGYCPGTRLLGIERLGSRLPPQPLGAR